MTSVLRMRRKRTTRALDDTTTTETDIFFRARENETDTVWAFLLRSLYPINGQWASKWAGLEWCRLIGIKLKWCIDECGAQAQRIVIVNIVDYLFYIYVWWLNKFSWAIFFSDFCRFFGLALGGLVTWACGFKIVFNRTGEGFNYGFFDLLVCFL